MSYAIAHIISEIMELAFNTSIIISIIDGYSRDVEFKPSMLGSSDSLPKTFLLINSYCFRRFKSKQHWVS